MADRIEQLVERLYEIPEPASREAARQLMAAILELQGEALQRILSLAGEAGEPGQALIRSMADDALTGGLLALHGLHPDSLETRVQRAIARLGGGADLVSVAEGNVKVKSSGRGLGFRLEQAVREACPDAASIQVEEPARMVGFVPVSSLTAARRI